MNHYDASGYVLYSTITIGSSAPASSAFPQLMVHEFGHTYNENDCTQSACSNSVSAMVNPVSTSYPTAPLCCDKDIIWWQTQNNPHPYGVSGNCGL